MFVWSEQGPEADGSPQEEGCGTQAGLRLQEEARNSGDGNGRVGKEVCGFLQSNSCLNLNSLHLLRIFQCMQAAQLSMNNVMQNEGEYVMQISALTSSLNVSKNKMLTYYLT